MVIIPNLNGVDSSAPFFAQEGDSGSALVNDADEVVGLHIGGSPRTSAGSATAGYWTPSTNSACTSPTNC